MIKTGCVYFYGCRFGGACEEKCGDARPTNIKDAQKSLMERVEWEKTLLEKKDD